mmetsp:Transcript_8997/g.33963  ORF Transcript_8997/g.33963 Transcript_8997/m.33963 type:complete len:385 (-) Transcript_8997:124-1278(-)
MSQAPLIGLCLPLPHAATTTTTNQDRRPQNLPSLLHALPVVFHSRVVVVGRLTRLLHCRQRLVASDLCHAARRSRSRRSGSRRLRRIDSLPRFFGRRLGHLQRRLRGVEHFRAHVGIRDALDGRIDRIRDPLGRFHRRQRLLKSAGWRRGRHLPVCAAFHITISHGVRYHNLAGRLLLFLRLLLARAHPGPQPISQAASKSIGAQNEQSDCRRGEGREEQSAATREAHGRGDPDGAGSRQPFDVDAPGRIVKPSNDPSANESHARRHGSSHSAAIRRIESISTNDAEDAAAHGHQRHRAHARGSLAVASLHANEGSAHGREEEGQHHLHLARLHQRHISAGRQGLQRRRNQPTERRNQQFSPLEDLYFSVLNGKSRLAPCGAIE